MALGGGALGDALTSAVGLGIVAGLVVGKPLGIVVACFIAILNRGSEVLFWTYISMALRGGGIFLPLTLAVFWPGHVKRGWAVLSMLGSTAASLLTATVVKLTIDPLFVGLIVSALLLLPGIRMKK